MTDSTRYRYRLKSSANDQYEDYSWATRDLAVLECRAITKRDMVTLFVVDSSSVPSNLIGACSNGLWRAATGPCKECKATGLVQAGNGGGYACQACLGFGRKVEPMPWVKN